MNNMKRIVTTTMIIAALALTIVSCGNSKKEEKGKTTDLKVKLEQLKKDKTKLDAEIRKVEAAIAKTDSTSENKAALVATAPVTQQDFVHYIELQGKVEAENMVYVTPRGQAAQAKQVYVNKGQNVKKGQLLIKLDDAIILQQMEGLKTQLGFAEDVYNRRKNLWDQGIGTEVELITAKNNVDNIKKQIATLTENWKTSFVYAPISGVAETVDIKPGEIFSGAGAAGPQLTIVNGANMKVVTEVPENYVSKVKKGSAVEIVVPDLNNKTVASTINLIGASINPTSRGFTTESKVPSSSGLKINQIATVRIKDYSSPNAISVPVNVVQTDENGKYVYVAVKEGEVLKARKKTVNVGEVYNGLAEIKMGLTPTDQVITEGYQNVYDGQTITTTTN
jgi:membrane fusion protein (multidrug efflux system)